MDLTIILTIIGVCLALPSFIALFCSPFKTAAILGIILGFVIIIFTFIFRRHVTRPSWVLVEFHKTVQIKSRTGKLAKITVVSKIKANHRGLTEFIHRNIRSDGPIRGFYFNSNPVPASDITNKAKEYIVREKFSQEVRRGEILSSHLTYDLIDSYRQAHEFTGYMPDYFTAKAKIEIHFPKNRPVINARAYCGIGAEARDLNPPIISAGNTIVIWEGKKLKPGQRYMVEWDW